MPGVSAGSRKVGAIEASKAMVSSPSGWPWAAAHSGKNSSHMHIGQAVVAEPINLRKFRRLILPLQPLDERYPYRIGQGSNAGRPASTHPDVQGLLRSQVCTRRASFANQLLVDWRALPGIVEVRLPQRSCWRR